MQAYACGLCNGWHYTSQRIVPTVATGERRPHPTMTVGEMEARAAEIRARRTIGADGE